MRGLDTYEALRHTWLMPSDLVFRAVVESIECAPIGMAGRFLDWIVKTRIEKMIEGDLTKLKRFEFRIHSPARSGLAVGTECTIRATWTGSGYVVDENQWHGAPT